MLACEQALPLEDWESQEVKGEQLAKGDKRGTHSFLCVLLRLALLAKNGELACRLSPFKQVISV